MDWRVGRASGDWSGSCKVCRIESDGKEGQITPFLLPSPENWQKGKEKRDGMGDPGGKQFSKSPLSWLLNPLGFPSTCLGHALSAQHATDNHTQLYMGLLPPFWTWWVLRKIFVFAEQKGKQHSQREDKSRWLYKGKEIQLPRGAIRKRAWKETEESRRGLNRCYEEWCFEDREWRVKTPF